MLIIKKCEYAGLDSTSFVHFTTTVNNSLKGELPAERVIRGPLLQPAILVTKLVKKAPTANMGFQDGLLPKHGKEPLGRAVNGTAAWSSYPKIWSMHKRKF